MGRPPTLSFISVLSSPGTAIPGNTPRIYSVQREISSTAVATVQQQEDETTEFNHPILVHVPRGIWYSLRTFWSKPLEEFGKSECESPTLLQGPWTVPGIFELWLSFLRHMRTDFMTSQVCKLLIVQKHNHDAVVLTLHFHPQVTDAIRQLVVGQVFEMTSLKVRQIVSGLCPRVITTWAWLKISRMTVASGTPNCDAFVEPAAEEHQWIHTRWISIYVLVLQLLHKPTLSFQHLASPL